MLNEINFSPNKKFILPNFLIYRIDHLNFGLSNCGGTAILVKHTITYHPIQIHMAYIENIIVHIKINNQKLKLESIYKNPASNLLISELSSLLNTSYNALLVDDLNVKNSI